MYINYEKNRRTRWEQVRALAVCHAAPKLIEKALAFPWDKEDDEDDGWSDEMEGLSDKERFEAAKKKMGAIN